jgi:hypothetical protein
MLKKIFRTGLLFRVVSVLTMVLATDAFLIPPASAAGAGILNLRCTNPVGGANWPIVVDLDRGFVDTRPATISDKWITWTDGKSGVYELERATGKLRLRAASTTGGFFLYYTCQSEQP